MSQFAVHQHTGRRGSVPFVVQIESTRLERRTGRVVMALVLRDSRSPPDHPLTPCLTVRGTHVFADPFNLATAPIERLGPVLHILPEPDQDRIIRAIDEMISRA